MSDYVENGKNFGWGPGVIKLNPEKASLLSQFAKGKCLDLGCGSGLYTAFLKSLGLDVIGVDNEADFINKARITYPHIKFVKSEATILPFKNNEFDTVILFDIIEHLDEKKILEEAARVGKILIISVPHSNQKILSDYSLVHAHYLDKTHLRTYTTKSLKKALKDAKQQIIECKPAMPISTSGLFINNISQDNNLKKLILKVILKPFLPEPGIFSTVFAIAKK